MAIRKTEAVILKVIPYGETSKILTTFTKDHGKITMVAKGARNIKSKFGGSLEPFTHLSVIFYEREARDLQYISDVSIINPFLNIHDHLDRMYAALSMIEICNKVIHGNEENTALFELLTQTLEGMNSPVKPAVNGFLNFLIQLADLLGFKMELERCRFCEDIAAHRRLQFNIDKGRIVCEDCPQDMQMFSDQAVVSKETYAVMRQMARTKGSGLYNIVISDRARSEIYSTAIRHLQYHADELKHLNALAYLKV